MRGINEAKRVRRQFLRMNVLRRNPRHFDRRLHGPATGRHRHRRKQQQRE